MFLCRRRSFCRHHWKHQRRGMRPWQTRGNNSRPGHKTERRIRCQLQADYFNPYHNLKLARDDNGVLVAEFHHNGGPFIMSAQSHGTYRCLAQGLTVIGRVKRPRLRTYLRAMMPAPSSFQGKACDHRIDYACYLRPRERWDDELSRSEPAPTASVTCLQHSEFASLIDLV